MDTKALTSRDLFEGRSAMRSRRSNGPTSGPRRTNGSRSGTISRGREAISETPEDGQDEVARPFPRCGRHQAARELPRVTRSARQVIDGQQRLTTLQLLLDAAQLVIAGTRRRGRRREPAGARRSTTRSEFPGRRSDSSSGHRGSTASHSSTSWTTTSGPERASPDAGSPQAHAFFRRSDPRVG